MAHFYGVIEGARGQATRCGTKSSGMQTHAASWKGAVRTTLTERNGETHALVELIPWHSIGVSRLLYAGPVDPAPEQPGDVKHGISD